MCLVKNLNLKLKNIYRHNTPTYILIFIKHQYFLLLRTILFFKPTYFVL